MVTYITYFAVRTIFELRTGEPLPIGFCAGGVPRASDKASVDEISAGMIRWPRLNRAIADVYNSTFIEGDLPPSGLLARAESEVEVGPDTWLTAAEGISANLELEGDTAVLRLPGAALRAGRGAVPLFTNLCEGKSFRLVIWEALETPRL